MSGAWRNRIVGHGTEHPEDLRANPRNWRLHPENQRAALRAALSGIGWVQQVIVNRQTGLLIDGHARVEEALRAGEESVPVVYVDLTDDEERKALAMIDPIGSLAGTDEETLRLLAESAAAIAPGVEAALEALLAGKPGEDFEPPDKDPYREQFGLIVICEGVDDQIAALEDLERRGFTGKPIEV